MPARLKVRLIPNARKSEIGGLRESELLIRVHAPAIDGRANKAAIEFLAAALSVPRSAVTLISGEKSRHKIFEIIGLETCDIERKLTTAGL